MAQVGSEIVSKARHSLDQKFKSAAWRCCSKLWRRIPEVDSGAELGLGMNMESRMPVQARQLVVPQAACQRIDVGVVWHDFAAR